jgi:adenosylcobinamide kinase/adenosylcobinamide-phosphate guanylyltransferase
VLVLGGARSGKSVEAERRLTACPSVTYVATGGVRPEDPEWTARVAAHRARRPPHWRTVEIGAAGEHAALLRDATGPVLVDCLTLWLTAVLDEGDAWDGTVDSHGDAIIACIDELVAAFRATRATVVAVSNEVGSGVVPATASGRRFRDELGRLNARIAAEADEVVWMVAGQAVPLRGGSA